MTSPTRGDSQNAMALRAEALGERLGRSLAGLRQRLPVAGTRDDETQDPGVPARDETRQGGAAAVGDGERIQRADQLVTRLQNGAVAYAVVIGQRLRRLAARLREEAEDIAAEARHVRTDRASERASGTMVVDETKHSAA
jgi:hypothetical protein